MKKLLVGAITGLGFVSSALAGSGGFSTIRINWSAAGAAAPGPGAGAEAIPTLGTWGALLLALLLALIVYRVSRKRDIWIRAFAPLATFGLAVSAVFMSESPVAGLATLPIDTNQGSGSQTYTADGPTPPPCFINNSGVPVTVTYTLIAGEDGFGTPLTPETCTFSYYCGDDGPGPALDGAPVPSDGLPYGTAYCQEIFSGLN